MRHKYKKKEILFAYSFLAPNFIGFFIFFLGPLVVSFVLSFTEWDLLSKPVFVGLDNYIKLFTEDVVFIKVLKNTLFFVVVTVPATMVLSLLSAVAVNTNIKGRNFYRLCFFLPLITSSVMVSVLWKWLLNGDFGLVNYILSLVGINGPNWLIDDRFALTAVCIVSVWKGVGYYMMIYLAGLQGIPGELYEAVEIDGGGKIAKFVNVTLPLLSSTTFLVFILLVIGSFQVFDIVNLMTQGGPARATSVIPHYLYENAFKYFKMGYASAISYVLCALIMIPSMVQFVLQGRRSKNE